MIKKIGHFHRILQLKLVDYNGFGHWCKCFVTHGLLIAGAGKKSTELLGLRQALQHQPDLPITLSTDSAW